MTWRIWSPVGSTSCSNASFETSFSSDAASALRDKEVRSASAPFHAKPVDVRTRCVALLVRRHRFAGKIEAPRERKLEPQTESWLYSTGVSCLAAPPSGVGTDPPNTRRKTANYQGKSGRLDLNQRPLGPQPSALFG